jgi:hypothetical protein
MRIELVLEREAGGLLAVVGWVATGKVGRQAVATRAATVAPRYIFDAREGSRTIAPRSLSARS